VEDSTRRQFLRSGGVVSIVGLAGCSQVPRVQIGNDIKDTDGDGVIDSEDYAPRDPAVQEAEDVEVIDSTEQDTEDVEGEETEEQPTEAPDTTDEPTEVSSGTVVLDDFEDTTQLGWSIDQGDQSRLEFVQDAARGDHSLHFVYDSEDVSTGISREIEPTRMSEFSLWFQYESSNDNNFQITLVSESEDRIQQFREFFGQIHYRDPQGGSVPHNGIAPVDQNEWYRFVVERIDFSDQTLDASVYNQAGNRIDGVTGASFLSDGDNVSKIVIQNGLGNNGNPDPLWIDHVLYRP
jgi:hypothetical protein